MLKAQAPLRSRGNDQGVWFKLAALHNSEDPLGLLMQLSRHYGGCIPLRMHSQRVFLLTEVEYFKHVLMTRSHGYSKYFEGLRPIFGGSMITLDGALWQKMRLLQQPAFHPDMIGGYIPQFITAIRSRMERWGRRDTDEPIDICEETWALAADMTCKALFDREMPFNPHLVFNAVKAYTNVTNHRSVRFRVAEAELCELVESELAQAAQTWVALPEMVLGSDPREGRERTLLRFLEAAAANPDNARIQPATGARRNQTIHLGRNRDDRADARLGALPGFHGAARRRTYPPRDGRGSWRPRTDWRPTIRSSLIRAT